MSAHFAIPATTFVLKTIIEKRLKLAYGIFTPPPVLVEPPPRPVAPSGNGAAQQPEASALILFLHHAEANPAWRNMYDPHIDARGARVANAPLVLDLHYMLAAQGQTLEREALLGVGMSALHRNAIVPRAMITALLGAITVPSAPTSLMESFTSEPLAAQPESITISQAPVDIDLSTKLWSALQAPTRPCAHYLVTTVFLDTGDIYRAGMEVAEVNVTADPTGQPALVAHAIQHPEEAQP